MRNTKIKSYFPPVWWFVFMGLLYVGAITWLWLEEKISPGGMWFLAVLGIGVVVCVIGGICCNIPNNGSRRLEESEKAYQTFRQRWAAFWKDFKDAVTTPGFSLEEKKEELEAIFQDYENYLKNNSI